MPAGSVWQALRTNLPLGGQLFSDRGPCFCRLGDLEFAMGNDLVRSGADFAEVSMIPLFVVRPAAPCLPCSLRQMMLRRPRRQLATPEKNMV